MLFGSLKITCLCRTFFYMDTKGYLTFAIGVVKRQYTTSVLSQIIPKVACRFLDDMASWRCLVSTLSMDMQPLLHKLFIVFFFVFLYWHNHCLWSYSTLTVGECLFIYCWILQFNLNNMDDHFKAILQSNIGLRFLLKILEEAGLNEATVVNIS